MFRRIANLKSVVSPGAALKTENLEEKKVLSKSVPLQINPYENQIK